MIVGAYVMHLYCDGPEHHANVPVFTHPKFDFSAPSESDCRRMAKKVGWTFKKGQRAFCPYCSKDAS